MPSNSLRKKIQHSIVLGKSRSYKNGLARITYTDCLLQVSNFFKYKYKKLCPPCGHILDARFALYTMFFTPLHKFIHNTDTTSFNFSKK